MVVVVVVVVACAQTGSGQSLMSTIASILSHHIIVSALARLAQLFTRISVSIGSQKSGDKQRS